MSLKENLKRIRKAKKISQKKLAELSAVSYSMVCKLESGEQSNPSLETIDKISSALGVKSSDLIGIDVRVLRDDLKFIEYLESIGYTFQNDMNPTEWEENPDGSKYPVKFDESPNAPCCTLIKHGIISVFTNQQFEDYKASMIESAEFHAFKYRK